MLVAVRPGRAARRARAVIHRRSQSPTLRSDLRLCSLSLTLIDSHCHLAGEEFATDLDDVVGARAAAGVSGALVIVAAEDDAGVRAARRR